MEKRGISIRYKLLLLLVLLPLSVLTLYLGVVVKIFKSDKIAYVHDSTAAVSRTLGAQAQSELAIFNTSVKSIWTTYDSKNNVFTSLSKKLFSDVPELYYYGVFERTGSQRYFKLLELTKSKAKHPFIFDQMSIHLIQEAKNSGVALRRLGSKNTLVLYAKAIETKESKGSFYVVTLRDAADLIQAFDEPSGYSNFLVNPDGGIIAGSNFNSKPIASFQKWSFFKKQNDASTSLSTLEINGPAPEHKKLLMSHFKIGSSGLNVVSLVEKEIALGAVSLLLWKSILFFIALLSLSTVISIIASRRLTSAIRQLYSATLKVAQGDFNVKVEAHSRDEVGGLAKSFNHMAVEIRSAHEKLQDYAKNLELKVEQRTKELADINQMLDAMVNSLGQGFLIFNSEGKCAPLFSKACLKLLETEPTGKLIWDILKISPDKMSDFQSWCTLAFQEPLPFQDMIQIAPKVYAHSKGRHIVLEYFPIRDQAQKLGGIVLVATDKTEELEATLLAKKEAAFAKRVIRITKNKDQFKNFIKESEKTFDSIEKTLSQKAFGPDGVEFVFQMVHTLKGDSGTFMLDFLFEKTHAFEAQIQDLRKATDEKRVKALPQLKGDNQAMKKSLEEFLEGNTEIVGDWRTVEKILQIPFNNLFLFFNELKKKREYTQLASEFQTQFLKEPIQKFFMHLNDLAGDLASKKDKKVQIQYQGGDLRIQAEPYIELFSTFVHAVRNSLDHGIENPEERKTNGKNPEGLIKFYFTRRKENKNSWLDIVFEDDGKGINPQIIREKLLKNGFTSSEKEEDRSIIQHVFDSGFSTRDSANELSGRGVGMGAIKAAAVKLGGDAYVESKVGQGTKIFVSVPEMTDIGQHVLRAV